MKQTLMFKLREVHCLQTIAVPFRTVAIDGAIGFYVVRRISYKVGI